MSLLIPDVGEVELLARLLYGRGNNNISGATNTTPIVITANAHGLSNGNAVTISDVGGNANANGTFIVGSVTTNTFALYATTTGTGGAGIAGSGSYTSGGSWNLAGVENATLKLYKTNVTPAETDTAGSYTEADFTGYSSKTLTSNLASTAWAKPATSSGTTSSNYPQQSWSATSAQTIYGYYIVGANSTTLLWAELFSSSISLINPSTLQLVPKLALD